LVLALAAVVATQLVGVGLASFRVLFFLTAVTLAALRGGTGPGLVAVAVCGVAYRLLSGGPSGTWLEEPDPVHRLAFFVGFAALSVWMAAAIGTTFRQAHARRRSAEARADEHRIAARLGLKALAGSDLDALLEETLAAVQEALRCDSVTLLQLDPAGETFTLRKAAGLGRTQAGRSLSRAEAKLASETVRRREVMAVTDLAAHPEIASKVLLDHGVVSCLTAPIAAPGPGSRSFGMMGAHWRTRHAATTDEASLMQTAANVVGTAVVRLQAEEQLRDHLTFLRAIAASLAEGVYALDRDGRATFVNAAAARMLGYTEEELLGKNVHDLVHARTLDGAPRPAETCPILAVAQTGQAARSQDDAYTRRDGTIFPIAYTASPLWRSGEVVGAVVAFQDFTEHVRAEQAEKFLAEAGQQLALSIDFEVTLARVAQLAMPVLGDWCLVVVVDPDGRPRSVAAEAADPARAAAARALLERYPIDREALHGAGRILRTGEPELIPEVSSDTFVGDDSSGELRREILRRLGLLSYMGAPLETGGRILGAISFGIAQGPRRFGPEDLALAGELARRCAVAIENASLYRAAQDATRAREEVLAIVSHDLKTPLGALLLGAQVVARLAPPGEDGDELRRASSAVRRTAERMGRLIHDLVDFGAIQGGRLSIRAGHHDAAAIARDAVEAFSVLAGERGVALVARAEPSLPVRCDRDRVNQVLSNLLSNALQVTDDGGSVALVVGVAGDEVIFTVTDTGPGIPEEDRPHVFDRWYRGRHASYSGSGLGLAIARGIIEAHHGRIWVESAEGSGATFAFTLPAGAPPREVSAASSP
jgi:PAS domain S-box-containing protein